MNNIAPQSPVMRRLTLQDNPAIARVIRQVSAEYGLTADKGYTVADPNLDELYQVYSQPCRFNLSMQHPFQLSLSVF